MNWPNLIDDVRIEIGLLDQLLAESSNLIRTVNAGRTDPTACLAAGGVLQSFYNGVEKVFGIITHGVGDTTRGDDNPRRSLLNAVAEPSPNRPAIIDRPLADQLAKYLEFREAFRYAHFFQLKWAQTAPLVTDMGDTLGVFKTQLDKFFSVTAAGQVNPALAARAQTMPSYWTSPLEPKLVGMSSRKVGLVMLVMAAAGLGLGAMAMKYRIAAQTSTVPSSLVTKFVENAKFAEPNGNVRKLPVGEKLKKFRVTDGTLTPDQGDLFTGRVAQQRKDDAISTLSISFNQGRAVFAEALNDQGQTERAVISDKRVIRYSISNPDGLPQRTYHVDENGQAYCVIEWDKFVRPGGTAQSAASGWHYRFYSKGAKVAHLFASSDGEIINVDGD